MSNRPYYVDIDDVKYFIRQNENRFGATIAVDFARQLLDALADNERMKNSLIKLTAYEGWTKQIALEGLGQSNKQSVPCGTCGKPMEDRGAANQWCKECVDNRYKQSEAYKYIMEAPSFPGMTPIPGGKGKGIDEKDITRFSQKPTKPSDFCEMCKGKKEVFCAIDKTRKVPCPVCQEYIFEIQSSKTTDQP